MKKSVSTVIITSFLSAILIGTFLLALPFSTVNGTIAVEDALFTSTSAVTVTGLIVVDTATYFTPFGQFIILILLQIGGLGFMTFSTFTILLMGRSFSLKDKSIIENDFTAGSYKNLKDLLKKIIIITFGIEFLGAVILYFQFTELEGAHRVFSAIFHSVSAFCNAGFSIYSRNFEEYIRHTGINSTLMVLIILGGLGFLVINEMTMFLRRKIKRVSKFSLHTKLVLITSVLLIFAGFLLIFIQELFNDNDRLSLGTKMLMALFQSVSARTAGFNTVGMNYLSMGSLFVIMVLMFIGASPGSTGGGIKTTSVGVAVAYIRSRLRGREKIDIFYRNIPLKTFEKAFMVMIMYAFLVVIFTLLVLTFERDFRMVDIIFETVSAFGTVGLSTGITAQLSIPSKIIIAVTMFIGRIGPLTLLIALGRQESKAVFHYPQENIMIG